MAEVIAPKTTEMNQTELDREAQAAKLDAYAAILKINQGFAGVVGGLEDLKRAGLSQEGWGSFQEKINGLIHEVWSHQAKLNCSVLNPLSAVEESDAIQCIRRRMERQSRQKTEDLALISVPQSSADHQGRPN
jgi:hypothetical protein